jgi:hypothetical protein
LDASADLPDLLRPLEHEALHAFPGEAKRGGKATDAATCDDERLVLGLGHGHFLCYAWACIWGDAAWFSLLGFRSRSVEAAWPRSFVVGGRRRQLRRAGAPCL